MNEALVLISFKAVFALRQCSLGARPGTVAGYDSKLISNVNTPFSKYPMPKFELGPRARVTRALS